nr:unnamed protein product [Callosobruchus chinensis]
MGDVQIAVTILCAIALVLLVFLAFFHKFDFLSWIQAWVRANKEEKVSLTRLKGHYNANGYLVHSDSDIPLTCSGTGSFRRFETVDGDFRMTTVAPPVADWTSVTAPSEDKIPPQPLRPAPVPGVMAPPTGTTGGEGGGASTHPAARRSVR